MLRKFFAGSATSKSAGYQKYANVPNIHLGLHYRQDIENFATAYNATTMMGEQKHKVFKQHAQHTNSKENDLQLLRSVNTSQTIRFMLDGAFDKSNPIISQQLRHVVTLCPKVRTRYLGHREDPGTVEPPTAVEHSGFNLSGTLLRSAKTGCAIPFHSIPLKERESDLEQISVRYREEEGVAIVRQMRAKVHYWGYLTGEATKKTREYDGQHIYHVKPGGFVRLREEPFSFYLVKRILTISVGTYVKTYFVLDVLKRDIALEIEAAPYPVFTTSNDALTVSIRRIDPVVFHFVTKSPNSWWFNPYVPYFM